MVREAPPEPDVGGEPVRRDEELDRLMESMDPETQFAMFMRDMRRMSKSRMGRELSGASTHQRMVEGNGKWPVRAKSRLPMPKPSGYLAWLISVKQEAARFEQQRQEQIKQAKERGLERLRMEQARNNRRRTA